MRGGGKFVGVDNLAIGHIWRLTTCWEGPIMWWRLVCQLAYQFGGRHGNLVIMLCSIVVACMSLHFAAYGCFVMPLCSTFFLALFVLENCLGGFSNMATRTRALTHSKTKEQTRTNLKYFEIAISIVIGGVGTDISFFVLSN